MRLPLLLGVLVLAVAVPPGSLAAQQTGDCRVVETEEVTRSVVAGEPIVYVRGPLLVRCAAGEELRADSAVVYSERNEVQLFRNVSYRDAERDLSADRGSYFSVTGRIHATGNVVFRDRARRSTLRGPELEYLRPMEGRPEARVSATGRPRLVALPAEDAPPADSVVIDADRISTIGEEQLSASGTVVIRRPDMTAYGSTAFYDTGVGRLDLAGDARVEAEDLELVGDSIRADLPGERLEHVAARGNAVLTGEDLAVRGRTLDLFFEAEVLQRLVSRGSPDAEGEPRIPTVAETADFQMEADSLDAVLPGQVLERVIAVGSAYAESLDTEGTDATLQVEGDRTVAIDRDWIRGDTITGFFVQASPAVVMAEPDIDEVPPMAEAVAEPERERVELERLLAVGTAGTLFRARDEDGDPDGPPSLNYVAGRQIELRMADGELEVANVEGLRRGVFLDAEGIAAAPPAPAGEDEEAGDDAPAPGGADR